MRDGYELLVKKGCKQQHIRIYSKVRMRYQCDVTTKIQNKIFCHFNQVSRLQESTVSVKPHLKYYIQY